jgi:hypothetical protein
MPAEKCLKFIFHTGKVKEAMNCTCLEIDHNINVTIRTEIIPENGTEKR